MPAEAAPLLPPAEWVVGCVHDRPVVVGTDSYTPGLSGRCNAGKVLAAGVTAAPRQNLRQRSPLKKTGQAIPWTVFGIG